MGALRLRAVLACVVALAVLGAGAADAGTNPSRRHVVRIKDIAFHPARLVVQHGDTVQWRWQDDPAGHNVTSVGRRRFHGGATRLRGRYSVRFRNPGTYRYHCTIHFGMTGVVVVR